ncbi:diacylglycerol/lipid kinase family protein [Frondihabitans australicus]|uniref:Diacylglycerol kinase family enzyme n=1 Tax=Frondihabitans australicus TaxID=386892 RepID=A0A495ILY3_9MICO|nr:diacylglycerol kinase family protein [Frondihabitans australicus]RKR76271.1 diacylglycerol kinase family enzyme [Frondihabitans australicus]
MSTPPSPPAPAVPARPRDQAAGEPATDETPKRTAAVVYNPIKVNLAELKKSVRKHQKKAGWAETLFYETSVDDPGLGMAKAAMEAGADMVIAAGGDGTVRNVAEALRGTQVALGLLPSGTGNLLARNLKLTLDHLDSSIGTAFSGTDRRIDLGLVEIENPDGTRDKRVFVVMAGLGLDAQMLANTNDRLKKRVGWLAYVDAIARSLRDNNALTIKYRLDGGERKSMKTHTIILGNCGLLPGNLLLLPDAAIDDGLFDIVALRPERKIDWIGIWVKIVWENGILRRSRAGRQIMRLAPDLKTVRYMKGSELVVRLDSPQDFELDGDSHGMAVAIRARIDPLALTVRVPA